MNYYMGIVFAAEDYDMDRAVYERMDIDTLEAVMIGKYDPTNPIQVAIVKKYASEHDID